LGIHGAKLTALLSNLKLPQSDKKSIILAIEKYKNWYDNLLALSGSYENIIGESVKLLNIYKNYIDFNIIFLSKNDFLYRQKGQLKLDNTIIEEILPLLVRKIFGEKLNDNNIIIGPTKCITGIRFDASITSQSSDGGMILKCKD
jgi:hypothetical protein